MATPPLAPVVLFAAVVGSGVTLLAWFARDTPGARPLAAFMLGASLWALTEGLTLVSATFGSKVFWTRTTATVSVVLPVAWLAAAVAYANADWRLTRNRLAALAVEPLAFVVLVWTNAGPAVAAAGVDHTLVWTELSTEFAGGGVVLVREYGLAFWAHAAYSYLLVATGAFVLVRLSFRTSRVFRGQTIALLGAVFAPITANALSIFDAIGPGQDLTSVGFVATGLVLSGAILRGELLAVAPATRNLGRETVVAEMDDAVVIVDEMERVVDANAAARSLFDADLTDIVGKRLGMAAPELVTAMDRDDTDPSGIELEGPDGRGYYDISVSPLRTGAGDVDGYVVSLHEVTDRRRREQRLDVLNRILRHNLRNELNVVYGNAELLRTELGSADGSGAEQRLDRIEETIETLLARSEKVGRVSRIPKDTGTRPLLLVDWLESVVADVENDHPDLSVTVEVPADLFVEGGNSLEYAVTELLTNAAEHAGASPTVEVTAARTGDGNVEILFGDDGPGIDPDELAAIEAGRETALEHSSGIGLWLVTWVVDAYGGTVRFIDADEGCTVVLALPTADGTDTAETDATDAAETDDAETAAFSY